MSAAGAHWSRIEVEAAVTAYVEMLLNELQGEPYSKTAHRQALSRKLQSRSDGSIERKHQNISAVLIELGYPYIAGYKPLRNYQALLAEAVADRVVVDEMLAAAVQRSVEAPAVLPRPEDMLSRLDQPPRAAAFRYKLVKEALLPDVRLPPVNYLEREARNSSLGRAGEEFVIRFERERLIGLDRGNLADRVEHTALVRADGAGFDVRSFERDGSDRFIEVKTTAYGKETPFFITRNELAVSRGAGKQYHLYRLFRFREDPRLYSVNGPLDDVCHLASVQYAARPR